MKQPRLSAVLSELGAKLKRQRKHLVFEFPNGQTFVTAKSPSDTRGEDNAIADAKRAAGMVREPHREGERRERRVKPGRAGSAPWRTPALSAALLDSGIVERQLRAAISDLEREVAALRAELDATRTELLTLQSTRMVRLMTRLKRL